VKKKSKEESIGAKKSGGISTTERRAKSGRGSAKWRMKSFETEPNSTRTTAEQKGAAEWKRTRTKGVTEQTTGAPKE
jgi:hypothetical protein